MFSTDWQLFCCNILEPKISINYISVNDLLRISQLNFETRLHFGLSRWLLPMSEFLVSSKNVRSKIFRNCSVTVLNSVDFNSTASNLLPWLI